MLSRTPAPAILFSTAVVEPNNQEIDVTRGPAFAADLSERGGIAVDTLEVRVNDGTLWSNWTSFTVTPPPDLIQTDGSTSLVEVGTNYVLNPSAGGTGPS